jgi:hypothetical protein
MPKRQCLHPYREQRKSRVVLRPLRLAPLGPARTGYQNSQTNKSKYDYLAIVVGMKYYCCNDVDAATGRHVRLCMPHLRPNLVTCLHYHPEDTVHSNRVIGMHEPTALRAACDVQLIPWGKAVCTYKKCTAALRNAARLGVNHMWGR